MQTVGHFLVKTLPGMPIAVQRQPQKCQDSIIDLVVIDLHAVRITQQTETAAAHTGWILSAFIATAFAQETPEAVSLQWHSVADQIRLKVPKLAAILDEAEPDVLAYMTFPREHRAGLPPLKWSSLKYGFRAIGGREHAAEEAQA